MEKYAAECKNQNFMSKLSLKALFGFSKLGFTSGLSTFFVYESLQGSKKLELKAQLPLES